jgi:amphi-Trp domain-containing protein
MEFERAVTLLENILSRMKQGKLVVGEGEETIVMTPSNKVEIGIEAGNVNGLQGLSFDLRWPGSGTEAQTIETEALSQEGATPCGLATEEACACSEEDFELAFLKGCGFFQPTSCSG